MITVFDSGVCNIGSVTRALSFLNADFKLTDELSDLEKAEKLLLPGVGSYSSASHRLTEKRHLELFRYLALEKKIPFLGICLGMQILSETGEENGTSPGLGLVKAQTVRLDVDSEKYSLPHVGWNDVEYNSLRMFEGIEANQCFYFVHSYQVKIEDPSIKIATSSYGEKTFCAAFEKENLWAAQFHPEKSQKPGLQLMKNFIRT